MSRPRDARRSGVRPSSLASWVAVLRVDPDEREFALGDLEEEFQEIARWQSPRTARAWYWRQALKAALWSSSRATTHGRRGVFLPPLLGDLRYALRRLRRAPGVAAAAIITLALAIGANVAVFTLIDRVVLRPLDLPEPTDLVTFEREFTGQAGAPVWVDYTWWANADHLRRMDTLKGAAISTRPIDPGNLGLVVDGAGGGAETVNGLFVSANYFRVLGARLALGRDFAAAEDAPGATPEAVLSNGFWLRRFGGDDSAIGQTITVNGTPTLVIGVAPATFTGVGLSTSPPDVYLPLLTGSRLATKRADHLVIEPATPAAISPLADFSVIARVRAGDQARTQAELESLFESGVLESRGGDHNWRVVRLVDTMLPIDATSDVRWFVALLGTAVGLTLLVGCANLGGLLLARVEERRAEMAVRVAVGASRLRLVQQLVVEAAVLVLAGGAAALVVARWIFRGFSAFVLPGGITVASLREGSDGRMFWFAALATILAAVLVGLAPTARAVTWDLTLEEKGQSVSSPRLGGARLLVALQVLVCTVLVFAAGIFARSLSNALGTDLGFEPRGLISLSLSLSKDGQLRNTAAVDALVERVRALPGVSAATPGPAPLVQGANITRDRVRVDGVVSAVPNDLDVVFATADYFKTLRQPLVVGRDFNDQDQDGAPLVAIVSEATAGRFWGHGNALGHRIGIPGTAARALDYTVVGVARDARLETLGGAPRPILYVARDQHRTFLWGMQSASAVAPVIVRVERDSAVSEKVLAQAAAHAGVPIQSVTTVSEAVDQLLMPQRFGRALLGLLGVLALALTLVGVYGLVSCIVARSAKEVGVRKALGAGSLEIVRALLSKAVVPVAAGLAVGAALAWLGGHYTDRFMYGMHGADPATLAVTVTAVVIGALAAAILPTRRALIMDTIAVLREG